MKMRNVFLAFALTILASFNFSSTSFATTADMPVIEDGVNGIIEDIILNNGTLILTINTTSTVELKLIAPNGQSVYSVKTKAEVLTIPTVRMAPGTYTVIAIVDGKSHFHSVVL